MFAGLGVTVGSDGMAASPGLCFGEGVAWIVADPPGSGAHDIKARPLEEMGGAGAPGNFRGGWRRLLLSPRGGGSAVRRIAQLRNEHARCAFALVWR